MPDLSKLSDADLNRLAAKLQGWSTQGWDCSPATDIALAMELLGKRGAIRHVEMWCDGRHWFAKSSVVILTSDFLEINTGNGQASNCDSQSIALARAVTEAWCAAMLAEKERK